MIVIDYVGICQGCSIKSPCPLPISISIPSIIAVNEAIFGLTRSVGARGTEPLNLWQWHLDRRRRRLPSTFHQFKFQRNGRMTGAMSISTYSVLCNSDLERVGWLYREKRKCQDGLRRPEIMQSQIEAISVFQKRQRKSLSLSYLL